MRNITCKRRKGYGAKREKQERWEGITVKLFTKREKKRDRGRENKSKEKMDALKERLCDQWRKEKTKVW